MQFENGSNSFSKISLDPFGNTSLDESSEISDSNRKRKLQRSLLNYESDEDSKIANKKPKF